MDEERARPLCGRGAGLMISEVTSERFSYFFDQFSALKLGPWLLGLSTIPLMFDL